jgi:uncharacterized protein YggE
MKLLSSILLATLATSVAGAQTDRPQSRVPEIAVSAVGETEVTPDRAKVMIGVQTRAATAADAAARNATLQTSVINAVKALGIAAEQITTSGYNVYPEQVYDQATQRSRITGYNVSNTVIVDVRAIDKVGPVLDVALSKGANVVSSLSFYSSQAEAARRKALQNAIVRARADAEAMAQAAGGTLGDLIELSSAYQEFSPPPRPMMEARMKTADAAATPISEGTQTIHASVNARWAYVRR